MSIALRFIPILLEETDKIMKAQTARGADFESGGLVAKAKSLIPVLVPLFISAFRRADELATAMEARCYRGDEGRTRMKELKYTAADPCGQRAHGFVCRGADRRALFAERNRHWRVFVELVVKECAESIRNRV